MMVKPCACETRQGLRVRGCGARVFLVSAGAGREWRWVAEPSGMAGRRR